jgi:hypothetical protein
MRSARPALFFPGGHRRKTAPAGDVSDATRNIPADLLEPALTHAAKRVHCPACHATVGAGLVYAAGNACPNCATPLCVNDAPCEPRSSPLACEGTWRAWGRARYLAEVRRSLAWADRCAERGDRAGAVAWLQMIEALGDPLPDEYQVKGQAWRSMLEYPAQRTPMRRGEQVVGAR